MASCSKDSDLKKANNTVESNIKKYTEVWDAIMNKEKLDLFNTTNFKANVIFHMSPENVVGIDNAKEYYVHYLTGFSKIEFVIQDVFGQGDKLTKHWTFKEVHTGDFFGIPLQVRRCWYRAQRL